MKPGTSEQEIYGIKFAINCCDKVLCNFKSIESSAQSTNKMN